MFYIINNYRYFLHRKYTYYFIFVKRFDVEFLETN